MDAYLLRRRVLDMAWAAGSGHLGGSFSCAELMAALYGELMRVDPQNPDWPARDRLILSKGHAAPMLYAALAEKGFFDPGQLMSLRDLGSPLQGHPCMFKLPGVDMSTGSLGMGLSVAVGMGLALRAVCDARVYVLMGDGECQEGQNWEAFMAMMRWDLTNITPILDVNGVQLDGTVDEVQPGQQPLAAKIAGFGLSVLQADGHDQADLIRAIRAGAACSKPHAVIANTVKGKGVSFMEGKAAWHGKPLAADEYAAAKAELSGGAHG